MSIFNFLSSCNILLVTNGGALHKYLWINVYVVGMCRIEGKVKSKRRPDCGEA